jgi:hypothetical protein
VEGGTAEVVSSHAIPRGSWFGTGPEPLFQVVFANARLIESRGKGITCEHACRSGAAGLRRRSRRAPLAGISRHGNPRRLVEPPKIGAQHIPAYPRPDTPLVFHLELRPLFRGDRFRRHAEQEESFASVKDDDVVGFLYRLH